MAGTDPREDKQQRLQRELLEERASALRRIAGKLERRLAAAQALRETLAAARGIAPDERAAAVAEHNRLVDEAEVYRWYLMVQRECIGVTDHTELDRFYPLPAKL